MTILKFKISAQKGSKQKEVLTLLRESRFELSVAQISEKLNIARSTATQHCLVLHDAKIILRRYFNNDSKKPVAVFVISPEYLFENVPTKTKKTFQIDCVNGKGVRRFVNQDTATGSGIFAGKKDTSLAFKVYVPPAKNPNYTPSGQLFLTSGRGFFNGVKA